MIFINFMGKFCNFSSLIFLSFRGMVFVPRGTPRVPRRATRRLEFVDLPYTGGLPPLAPKSKITAFIIDTEPIRGNCSLFVSRPASFTVTSNIFHKMLTFSGSSSASNFLKFHIPA